jgi:O-antigen biosynthesis protein
LIKEILYFSSINWDFLYQRPHHILSRLARKGFRIIYIEPSFSLPRLRTKLSYEEGILKVEPGIDLPFLSRSYRNFIDRGGIIVLKSASPIAGWIASVKKMDKYHSFYNLLSISAQATMQLFGFSNPAIWTNQPYWLPVIRNLSHAGLVYDCLDEIRNFEGHSDVIHFENDLIRKAKLVLCTAEMLYRRCLSYNRNSYLVPNAVDFDHFKLALDHQLLIPDDIRDIPSPIIGYVGCVSDWFDMNLLIEIAVKNAQWSFVIIGPVICRMPANTEIPSNIYFLGKRNYYDLPRYLKQFDVGIIPFKITPLTLSTDPVKLYEYFAAGVPVVSTDLPEVCKYKPLVAIATDGKQFSEGIRLALGKKDVKSYLDIAMANTWDARCRDIMVLLEKL